MKRFFLSLLALSCMCLGGMAQTTTYGNYHGDESNLRAMGTGKAETYSLAMCIDEPSLAGARITAVNVPVNTGAENASGYCAFVASELKASAGRIAGDLAQVEFTPDARFVRVELPEPYTMTGAPVYVGYSFDVTKAITEDDRNPVLCTSESEEAGSFYIVTSRTYRKASDVSASVGASLALTLELEGEMFSGNRVCVLPVRTPYVKVGEEYPLVVTLSNRGSSAVTSFDYELKVQDAGNTVGTGHVELDAPLSADFYGNTAMASVVVPAVAAKGLYDATLTITHVNGEANEADTPSAGLQVQAMNIVPAKRPLLEEFTGTWCGFCPAGYVALKLMNERHPDFICASYHNQDAMQITTHYPIAVDGYPMACIDRGHLTDAYCGDSRKDMGIELLWKEMCESPTPANVYVSASLDDATGMVSVNSQYEFCLDVAQQNLGVAYIITADGLHGTGSDWRQHNYFSPEYQGGAFSYTYHEGMEQFNEGAEYQYLVYDDVVVAESAERGESISGVIPASVGEGDIIAHEYSFCIADMNSNFGKFENLVQDKNRLHAIALLIDAETKAVINCAKCDVMTEEMAISDVHGAVSQPAAIYSVDGIRLSGAQRGINIIRMTDGSSRVVNCR